MKNNKEEIEKMQEEIRVLKSIFKWYWLALVIISLISILK